MKSDLEIARMIWKSTLRQSGYRWWLFQYKISVWGGEFIHFLSHFKVSNIFISCALILGFSKIFRPTIVSIEIFIFLFAAFLLLLAFITLWASLGIIQKFNSVSNKTYPITLISEWFILLPDHVSQRIFNRWNKQDLDIPNNLMQWGAALGYQSLLSSALNVHSLSHLELSESTLPVEKMMKQPGLAAVKSNWVKNQIKQQIPLRKTTVSKKSTRI